MPTRTAEVRSASLIWGLRAALGGVAPETEPGWPTLRMERPYRRRLHKRRKQSREHHRSRHPPVHAASLTGHIGRPADLRTAPQLRHPPTALRSPDVEHVACAAVLEGADLAAGRRLGRTSGERARGGRPALPEQDADDVE